MKKKNKKQFGGPMWPMSLTTYLIACLVVIPLVIITISYFKIP